VEKGYSRVMSGKEGVIKFQLEFRKAPPVVDDVLREVNGWRKILHQLGLIGRDPDRYGGFGYGNISRRLGPARQGHRPFIITGSQTGGLAELTAHHYAKVLACDPKRNLVKAEGPIRPSSEALTHAMIYDLDPYARFVMHVHSREIWQKAHLLNLPKTSGCASYGTPEMAEEVERLFWEARVKRSHIFVMGGHEDGVISIGRTAERAAAVLLSSLARASQM
jgi:ribulose-5-phosphate 4-epimerase/fuculose-1-phosphate aldolase